MTLIAFRGLHWPTACRRSTIEQKSVCSLARIFPTWPTMNLLRKLADMYAAPLALTHLVK